MCGVVCAVEHVGVRKGSLSNENARIASCEPPFASTYDTIPSSKLRIVELVAVPVLCVAFFVEFPCV